jgi:uncharacterized protein (TIGR02271 family)
MDTQELTRCIGRDLVGSDGEKIGKIEHVYADSDTGRPEWFSITSGLFGMRQSFVPITGTEPAGDAVRTQWTKDKVKDAPNVDADEHLSEAEEERLYRHYGMTYSERHSSSGLPDDRGTRGTTGTRRGEGYDTSGPTTDDAMTRSEEELRFERTREQRGTARLRKWVDTEHVQESVPVTRETARVEREPITDANRNRAMSGPELSEEEHEMPLMEEDVRAEKKVVPKERVRLEKDTETEQQQVEADVRKERIEAEGDIGKKGRGR